MNMNFTSAKNFFLKNKIKVSAALGAILLFLVILSIFSHIGTDRRLFLFPVSGSSKLQKEVRYLDSNPVQGKIQYYIDELILGPSLYRSRPIFTAGTKVEYCFMREKTLYVGLSEQAILQEGGSVEMSLAVSLFKENIQKNFKGIKNIELFIDGNFIAY